MITRASWGLKHICPACESRYYDLKKSDATCPSCGAKPPAPRVPRSRPGSRPSSSPSARPSFNRFR